VDVRPPRSSNWYLEEDGIAKEDQLPFNKFVKKLLVMEHVPYCSQCGTQRQKTHPLWMVNKKLCTYCLADNLISDQVWVFIDFSLQPVMTYGILSRCWPRSMGSS
jgi:hypothetical protein